MKPPVYINIYSNFKIQAIDSFIFYFRNTQIGPVELLQQLLLCFKTVKDSAYPCVKRDFNTPIEVTSHSFDTTSS